MHIRAVTDADVDGIWSVLEPMIREGETYPYPRDMSRDDALATWFAPQKEVFVAEENGKIIGTYYLNPNPTGGGTHVANCGYVTAVEARGRGIARALCAHSLERARARGFTAMQFNFVISTNDRAVHLWQSMGFEIVGRLPKAFRHPTAGLVDAFVMYRFL